MTIATALRSVSAYPVPMAQIQIICATRGLDYYAEADATELMSDGYKLATADLYLWLSLAPNISQGGQTYSLSEEQRKAFISAAHSIMKSIGETEGSTTIEYGYKGSRL